MNIGKQIGPAFQVLEQCVHDGADNGNVILAQIGVIHQARVLV